MTDLTTIPARYVATWHEPDADRRGRAIRELWAQDCSYYNTEQEFHGRVGIEQAVADAHEHYVEQGYVFTVRTVTVNHGAVRYQWVMSPAAGGAPAAAGTHVVTLDDDGLMTCDHQFPDPVADLPS